MLLMTCKDASWSALGVGGNRAAGCAGVQLLLCRQFELARAVRTGVRPSLAREIETGLHLRLHECFAMIPGIGFRHAPVRRCDVCRIIDATRHVACSRHAQDFAAFLAETWDDKNRRLAYDLSGVFQKYADAVGGSGGGYIEQMIRATAVLQRVRDMLLAGRNETACAVSIMTQEASASGVLDAMIDSSRRGLEILLGRHLRVT